MDNAPFDRKKQMLAHESTVVGSSAGGVEALSQWQLVLNNGQLSSSLVGVATVLRECVQAIHKMGIKVIAQDERTAEFFEMPSAAIATGAVDFVLPVGEIASTIKEWVMNKASQ